MSEATRLVVTPEVTHKIAPNRPSSMKGAVARIPLGTTPSQAHATALITYRDAHGQQMTLPQSQLRESFTGLQMLTQQVLGDVGAALCGWEQNFSIMQLGPSAFEIELRAESAYRARPRGRARVEDRLAVQNTLEHLADVLIDLGETACFMACHPEAELRYVDGYYSPYYEFMQHGVAAQAIDAQLLELLVAPEAAEGIRSIVANLKQPGVTYATISKNMPRLRYTRRTQVPVNDQLRAFADGAPLRFTPDTLEAARAAATTDR